MPVDARPARGLNLVRYSDARRSIRDGDLLLFRRRGLISIAGRGVHSHAAKAAWWADALEQDQASEDACLAPVHRHGDLFCLEVREFHGGRIITLSSQVARYPGRIDVYETNPDNLWPAYDPQAATRYMRRLAGSPYGYWNIVRAACRHLPLIRLFAPVDCDDREQDGHPPFCSEACSAADRVGGAVDPVLNLPDRLTEPSDLARSPFYRYRCTLLP